MNPPFTRRRFLSLSATGMVALSGCQSISLNDPKSTIKIAVTNATGEKREIWVQLTRANGSDPIGESVQLAGRSTTVLQQAVSSDTYRLTASVDDPNLQLKRRVEWEITEQSCTTTGVITLTAGEKTPELLVHTASCDEA